MKQIKDLFSGHADQYAQYRPQYPQKLYAAILDSTDRREHYWDCATGNGQVARDLGRHFKYCYATDVSANQLAQAPQVSNIKYGIGRAEHSGFPDDFFDLITVAQALHWFDTAAFAAEALRVGRTGAVLAVWGYGLLRLGEPLDTLISHFYREVVGPYWEGERRHIDGAYSEIELPLDTPTDLGNFRIERVAGPDWLRGYLATWSSVQQYRRSTGEDPVPTLMEALAKHWKDGEPRRVIFPIFGRMGRLLK